MTISKWFCEISIWITPLLSDRYCHFRRFLHKVSLCCFLLLFAGGVALSLASVMGRAHCIYWITWGIKTRIRLLDRTQRGGCFSVSITGASWVSRMCVYLNGRVACLCAWQRVSPVADACLTWCISKLWPGPSNMNLFCFTLVRCIIFLNF